MLKQAVAWLREAWPSTGQAQALKEGKGEATAKRGAYMCRLHRGPQGRQLRASQERHWGAEVVTTLPKPSPHNFCLHRWPIQPLLVPPKSGRTPPSK